MTGPMFSILIPTRNRPDTFRHSLQTVLNQPGDDFEIVVSDNASGPGTLDVIREAESPRIRYLRSDEVLPMTDNWEKGLQACTGQYVTILGDDDGLVPSSLPCARLLLSKTKARVLNWSPHTYWWPDTIVHWNKNRLIAKLGNGAHWYGASSMLKLFYDGSMGFDRLPMIYSSFVHRDCIETAVKKHGSYFCIPHVPDVVSGVINLIENDQILYSDRPLSIRGNSGKSNGTAQWARSLGGEQRESYFKDERARLQDIIHPHLVPSPNLKPFVSVQNYVTVVALSAHNFYISAIFQSI